jgi:hypothetical protein
VALPYRASPLFPRRRSLCSSCHVASRRLTLSRVRLVQLTVPGSCGVNRPGIPGVLVNPGRFIARDLPETVLCATSRRLTTQPSAAPFTCSVAWVGEVVHGDVKYPSINGMQGVRGSNPLSSTRHNASADHPLRAACQQIVSRSLQVSARTPSALTDLDASQWARQFQCRATPGWRVEPSSGDRLSDVGGSNQDRASLPYGWRPQP